MEGGGATEAIMYRVSDEASPRHENGVGCAELRAGHGTGLLVQEGVGRCESGRMQEIYLFQMEQSVLKSFLINM